MAEQFQQFVPKRPSHSPAVTGLVLKEKAESVASYRELVERLFEGIKQLRARGMRQRQVRAELLKQMGDQLTAETRAQFFEAFLDANEMLIADACR